MNELYAVGRDSNIVISSKAFCAVCPRLGFDSNWVSDRELRGTNGGHAIKGVIILTLDVSDLGLCGKASSFDRQRRDLKGSQISIRHAGLHGPRPRRSVLLRG